MSADVSASSTAVTASADGESNNVTFSETFTFFTKPKVQCRVTLTRAGISVENLSTRVLEKIDAVDIVGCHCMRPKSIPGLASLANNSNNNTTPQTNLLTARQPDAYICVYAYTCKKKNGEGLHFKRRSHIWRVCKKNSYQANLRLAAFWRTLVLCVARGIPLSKAAQPQTGHVSDVLPARKPMLILINPKSGAGHALQVFRQRVLPVLSESDTPHDVIVTSRAGEARQLAAERDLTQWSSIVIVSGDGLLYEVYNGILSRVDWHRWLQFPVALVPAGSGNGMAASVAHACGLLPAFLQNPVLTSSLSLAKCLEKDVDLMMVRTEQEELVGFLSIGWGLLADIDIESERLRLLGGARFSLWAAARVLNMRTYRGAIYYLPGSGTATQVPSISDERRVERPRLGRSITFEPASEVDRKRTVSDRLDHQDSIDENSFTDLVLDQVSPPETQPELGPSTDAEPPTVLKFNYPGLSEPPPDDWHCIKGEFVLVYGSLPSHISGDMHLNPAARLSDGLLHLHVLRAGVTRAQVLQYLFTCTSSLSNRDQYLLDLADGSLVNLPFVEVYPVRALRLVPETPSGYITLDGEVVHYGPVQAEVHRGIGRVLCPRDV